MTEEFWKPVEGFEQFYEVSNLGRVKSLRSGKVRKPVPNRQTGYLALVLVGEGFRRTMSVHRLVATAFCERHDGCDCINHKDENKHNNVADNLEWCTHHYNDTYNGKDQRCCKPVKQLDENFNVIALWSSARKANEETGIEYKNISAVCRGLRPRAGGYRWRFTNG